MSGEVVAQAGAQPGAWSRGRLIAAAVLAVAVAAAALAPWAWPTIRGFLLFNGHAALSASIAGGVALPPAAAACVNCHDGAASGGPRPIARLDRTTLTAPRTPRGGLPVVYDAGSFCRLLREGVDPASVLVSRLMPRFSISDEDCAAIFAYASRRP